MKSIIGKKYIPSDNSYAVNVTQCGDIIKDADRSSLAGDYLTQAVECIIVSEPFLCNVITVRISNPKDIRLMIMVDYDGETHMVMFNKNNIINT